MNTPRKLKVLDLFSGIGGFSLGLERTGGFETIAFCEIDENCREVLYKHWPEITAFHDIRYVKNVEEMYDIDVICGGYPCSGHSVAGKKEGLKNEASNLWYEYLRLIGEIKPRYVIIENSHNLRSTGLAGVIQDLCEKGLNCEWQIFSGYGIGSPHQRERIYIVAWRNDIPYPDPFRSWPTYSKKEETKSEWWAKRRFERNPLYGQIPTLESKTVRTDDGSSNRLHISGIEERIKQLGNSLVVDIVYEIGKGILASEAQQWL
jgi:DNA (cytosine-5)-methyltransferase 1